MHLRLALAFHEVLLSNLWCVFMFYFTNVIFYVYTLKSNRFTLE